MSTKQARMPPAGLVCAALAAASAGCAPVFSDFQSAKLVGRERVEVTPSYSSVAVSGDDGGHVQDELGLQIAEGVLDRVDLRGRYVRVEGVNVVGLGPKIGLVKDKVALAIPVGFAFGKDVDSGQSWAVHPTLILTAPVSPSVEFTASTKALVPLSASGEDTTVAVNLGAGLGKLDSWAIRPEIGFLFDPGKKGHYTQLGVGLTLFAGKRKPTEP
jgi:hypothetical protein